jgi:hypothetical protein
MLGHHILRCKVLADRQLDSGEISTCGEAHTKTQHTPPPFSEATGDKLPVNENAPRYAFCVRPPWPPQLQSISGLVAEYIVAIDVTRVQFPADAFDKND